MVEATTLRACRRAGLLAQLGLEEALCSAELSERSVPVPTMHAARVLLGTASELSADLGQLRKPASLATEQRVLAALRDYCKAARQAPRMLRCTTIAERSTYHTRPELRLW